MNNILTVAVISVLAASILLIGASTPVFAQNMTMDNSTAPVQNTTDITETGMGMDGNKMMGDMGDNMTGDNMMMGDNMTGMQ